MKKAAIMFLSFVFTAVSVGFFPMVANAGYEGQIAACLEARKKGQAKTIQDYVCPEGIIGDQDVAYQVVLDLEFKKSIKTPIPGSARCNPKWGRTSSPWTTKS
jgi:hypothetical protein